MHVSVNIALETGQENLGKLFTTYQYNHLVDRVAITLDGETRAISRAEVVVHRADQKNVLCGQDSAEGALDDRHVQVSGSTVTWTIPAIATAAVGQALVQLRIFFDDDSKGVLLQFAFTVRKTHAAAGDLEETFVDFPSAAQIVQEEAARVEAEAMREQAEAQRQQAEDGRLQAEQERALAETERSDAEAKRQAAESERAENEQERQSTESLRQEGEEQRAATELDRAQAETLRLLQEAARVQAENLRAQAELLRVQAEGGREQDVEAALARCQQAAERCEDIAAGIIPSPSWEEVEDKPTFFPPSAHASSHQTAGDDPLSPADIGAQPAITAVGLLIRTAEGISGAVAGVDYQEPLEAGVDYQEPLEAGVDYQKPLRAGVDYQKPLRAGVDYQEPLEAGVDYQEPLEAGVDYQEPLEAGVDYQEPLRAGIDYSLPMRELSVTLTPSGWSGDPLQQTISVEGVTTTSKLLVALAPGYIAEYAASGIFCSAQGDGNLTFQCASAPDVNVDIQIGLLG